METEREAQSVPLEPPGGLDIADLLKEALELAIQGGFVLPPLPPGIVLHPQLGDLHDRLQLQGYGLRVARSLLERALKPNAEAQPASCPRGDAND